LSPPPHPLQFAVSSLTCTFSTRFEDGSRSPYTLSHLSVDGRFLLTYGPQRGLQLLDLHLRAVVLTVPAVDTGALEAVFCGAQAPADAAAAGGVGHCSKLIRRRLFTASPFHAGVVPFQIVTRSIGGRVSLWRW
jgi:hypothetical protein